MSLRRWAGEIWVRPGVSAACLALQDDYAQCIPLLLWALWLSETGARSVGTEDQAVALCRTMDAEIITPLRAARRLAVSPERDRLLAVELAAEHDLLDRLEALGGLISSAPAERLADLSRRWGRPLDSATFEPLIEALRAREAADVG